MPNKLLRSTSRRIPVAGEAIFEGLNHSTLVRDVYTFTVPDDVTEMSAVCVGSGSAGSPAGSGGNGGRGGAGGHLSYGTFPVTPGETLTIYAGTGAWNYMQYPGVGGGSSYIVRQNGQTVLNSNGDTQYTQARNAGGTSGGISSSTWAGGGSGAGGYSGVGGNGQGSSGGASNGQGGGGGGGTANNNRPGYNGGGVGIWGEGTSGTGGGNGSVLQHGSHYATYLGPVPNLLYYMGDASGTASSDQGEANGIGASYGDGGGYARDGWSGYNGNSYDCKPYLTGGYGARRNYGAGGGGAFGAPYNNGVNSSGSCGGPGAVRLVWGDDRVYPNWEQVYEGDSVYAYINNGHIRWDFRTSTISPTVFTFSGERSLRFDYTGSTVPTAWVSDIPAGKTVTYHVMGGGGSGGQVTHWPSSTPPDHSCGGGAGEYVTGTFVSEGPGQILIPNVGLGGNAVGFAAGYPDCGNRGSNTTFRIFGNATPVTALGGGGGSAPGGVVTNSGASGGGGGVSTAVEGLGNDGGTGYYCSGGGGAGGPGGDDTSAVSTYGVTQAVTGVGGAGVNLNLEGTTMEYCKGGYGGHRDNPSNTTYGSGGVGGDYLGTGTRQTGEAGNNGAIYLTYTE